MKYNKYGEPHISMKQFWLEEDQEQARVHYFLAQGVCPDCQREVDDEKWCSFCQYDWSRW